MGISKELDAGSSRTAAQRCRRKGGADVRRKPDQAPADSGGGRQNYRHVLGQVRRWTRAKTSQTNRRIASQTVQRDSWTRQCLWRIASNRSTAPAKPTDTWEKEVGVGGICHGPVGVGL